MDARRVSTIDGLVIRSRMRRDATSWIRSCDPNSGAFGDGFIAKCRGALSSSLVGRPTVRILCSLVFYVRWARASAWGPHTSLSCRVSRHGEKAFHGGLLSDLSTIWVSARRARTGRRA